MFEHNSGMFSLFKWKIRFNIHNNSKLLYLAKRDNMFQNVFCVHVRIDNENDYNEHDAIEKQWLLHFIIMINIT